MRKMEGKTEVRFMKEDGHVYVYHNGVVIASYWRVSGLARDDDGKYVVTAKDGRLMGRITGEAIVKESW